MSKIVFTRIHHSMDKEYGHLSKFGCVEISNGICWLAAATRKSGYATEILDALPLKLDNEDLARLIIEKKPAYVGISACTLDIDAGAELAALLKKANPKIITIVGGPHVTAIPEETMEGFASFDIGVIGEGEDTIIDLLNSMEQRSAKRMEDVEGIIYRKEARPVKTAERPFIKDLDNLPLPAWDLLPDLRRHYFAPAWTMHSGHTSTITTSRGCPFQCIYCDRKVFGNAIRYHSAGYVLDMLKALYFDYGITHFRIGDDNFIINKERLFGICDLIVKEGLKISWSCLARADSVNKEVLAAMKRAGCWSIAFGVETGSQEIHDIEKKNITLDEIAKAVALTRKAKIKTIGFNIIGHPLETVETIKKTIGFNKKIGVDEFKTQFMVPFPGTELYREAEKFGTLDKDWRRMGMFQDPVFVPYGLTKEDMIKWNKKGFTMFYTQPRIVISYLCNIRSWNEFKTMLMGGLTLVVWKIKELFSFSARDKCGKKTAEIENKI